MSLDASSSGNGRSEKPKRSSNRAPLQAKYLYSWSKQQRTDSGTVCSLSREIEPPPSLRNRVHFCQAEMETISRTARRKEYPFLHNGLFSRSLKRRKILRLLASYARFGERSQSERARGRERERGRGNIMESRDGEEEGEKGTTSDISINYRQAGSPAASDRARRNWRGGEKKLLFYSISRKK